ncbi:MAG: glycosyltransferase family 2 protein [Anaerolineaceae bacterium]|nr:glycosyltransferase family 2 protein [Anaerolineaceae bacterium]
MPKLSIIIPVYYNEKNLPPLYEDIREKIIKPALFDYEIVMVDDGSGDESWAEMEKIAAIDKNVRIYHLSRNFGSHAAILCGLEHCTGDCAVVKAADLQEPTEIIIEMYRKWQEGYNVVLAVREDREESFSQKFFANFYYRLVRTFALKKMPKNGFDIYLIDRKVINVLSMMDEKDSALTGQILWSGFKTAEVPYVRLERKIGKSRWTLQKKIKLVMDTLYSFSSVPITLVMLVGAFAFAASIIWGLVVLINKIAGNIPVSGFTTMFIFQLFSFGITMTTLGVIGGYLWRTFDASRNRPIYIIEKDNVTRNDSRENCESLNQEISVKPRV